MIDQGNLASLTSIFNHLKATDGYPVFIRYWEDRKKQAIESLMKQSGSLTAEELIAENAKCEIYDELINFDITLERSIDSR